TLRSGEDYLEDRGDRGCTQAIRGLAKTLWNRTQRVIAERGDHGRDHDPNDQPGAEGVETAEPWDDLLQSRRHNDQSKVPVDDGGNARQQLERRFADLA